MAVVLSFARGVRGIFGGASYIAGESPDGLLTVGGAPAARRIDLFVRAGCRCIGSTRSAADGTYAFHGLDPAIEYDLIGRDWARVYGDVIAYAIEPEPYA